MSLKTELNTSLTINVLSAANKIVRFVVNDDVTALSQYLLALVGENEGIKRTEELTRQWFQRTRWQWTLWTVPTAAPCFLSPPVRVCQALHRRR